MSERGGDEVGSGDGSLLGRLYASERDPGRRRTLTVVGLVVGLLLATVHWSGLFLGGALVGLAQPTLRRALLAGLGYGLAALVVAGASVAAADTLDALFATWPLVAIGVAVPLLAGFVGALVRGVLPDAPPDGPAD